MWLIGSDIPEYSMGNRMNHKPKRPRKLLLHRREIAKFAGKATERGFTLVPLKMYFKNGRAKVELAVAAVSNCTTSEKRRKRPTLKRRFAGPCPTAAASQQPRWIREDPCTGLVSSNRARTRLLPLSSGGVPVIF